MVARPSSIPRDRLRSELLRTVNSWIRKWSPTEVRSWVHHMLSGAARGQIAGWLQTTWVPGLHNLHWQLIHCHRASNELYLQ